jgi:N-methylhydantoinase A
VSYRIAVDTGGTFTDVVVADEKGRLFFNKALTTLDRMFDGASEALRYIAADMDISFEHLMANSTLFIYGTTRATNAIVEKKTAPTAFFTTEGHPDILRLKEGGKHEPFNFRMEYPEPYIPSRLTFEIPGRINAQGDEIRPLNEPAVRAAVRAARAGQAEAIAVCLLWSIANSSHERRVREIILEEWPGVPVTLSHELNPTIREYRRASSAAIDASLKPLMQSHLGAIRADLAGAGFGGELVVVTSFGGALHVEEVFKRPIYTVGSGPSMAPVAADAYGSQEVDHGNFIVGDSGGTTFDVSLVEGRQIKKTRETWLGPQWTGDITGLSSVEVTSIGAGGGSIAWIDKGGLLRVGPHSSGSTPGPACYGRGGDKPTVTDAAAVLGYFNPDYFLGGRMTLDLASAQEAIRSQIAEPLGIELRAAAWAILAVANEAMVSAVREITINQGVDPRESIFVAGGGAGGLNAVMLAQELGCNQVLVPKTAGALSAAGAQFADIVAEVHATKFMTTARFDADASAETLAKLDADLDEFAANLPETLSTQQSREYSVEARYPNQVWDLPIPIAEGHLQTPAAIAVLQETFHAAHERSFAVKEEGQDVEWDLWAARMTVPLSPPDLSAQREDHSATDLRAVSSRSAYFGATGDVDIPCFDGDALGIGALIEGPAIIEERTTTIVLPPGCRARVTPLRSLLIDLDQN